MRRARFFLFYWLPPVALMSLIFYLSSLSGLPDFRSFDIAMKKGAHLTVYGLLYLLLFRAFHAIDGARVAPSIQACSSGRSPEKSWLLRLRGATPSRNHPPSHGASHSHAYVFAALVALLYAISDEIHQSFVPFRNATVQDVAIDAVGMFLMYILLKKKPALFHWLLGKPVIAER